MHFLIDFLLEYLFWKSLLIEAPIEKSNNNFNYLACHQKENW